MTGRQSTCSFISKLAISLLALVAAMQATAQSKTFAIAKDSVAVFQGVGVVVDIAGPVVLAMSDYGEYEAAVHVNLHNQYFPVVELGYGMAEHDDEVTELYYKTKAPYFRIGCDLNILKNKATQNRLHVGLRYAFTSYKVDIARHTFEDPVWGWDTGFSISGEKSNQHWAEVVLGLDTKIWGPIRLGWDVRYRLRLAHKDNSAGNAWYVPGFGKTGNTRIGAHFNFMIEI